MARRPRSARLETRTARLQLAVRKKPHFVTVSPGIAIGYRRNRGAGTWVVRAADGQGSSWTKVIAVADDYEDANAGSVLDFWQAQERARQVARGDQDEGARPATVAEAVDAYEDALRAKGAEVANATRVRFHLTPGLASKLVSILSAKELRSWRAGLIRHGASRANADRTARMLAAALSQAARDDPRITNGAAWKTGLQRLENTSNPRNVILDDATVRAIVQAAYEIGGHEFGLLIELLAVTGQRFSQLARLVVADLQDGPAPRLLVPSSRKGKNRRIERRPIPIPPALAAALRQAAGARSAEEPLLVDAAGAPWRWVDLIVWRRITTHLQLDRSIVPYALRHSAIVRQLVGNVPIRVVAVHHDTSVAMLESAYSRYIAGDPTDVITRRVLLDVQADSASNIVPISGRSA